MMVVPASKQPNVIISFEAANMLNAVLAIILTAATLNFLFYFIRRKIYFIVSAILFITSIGLSFVNGILKLHEQDYQLFSILFGTASFISFIMLCFTFFIAIRDIFGKNLQIGSSLLGAANIYLLIASGFAFLYAFLSILMPGAMVPISESGELLNHCIINSTYTLAGMDLPMEVNEKALHNLMMFESIFAHLFAVFIVGRLLAK